MTKGRLEAFSHAHAIASALSRGDPVGICAPGLADAIYVSVALIWLVPDRRIEKTITSRAV